MVLPLQPQPAELPDFIEITPKIYGVACPFGDGGIVYVYILKAQRPALVDTGVRNSPQVAIGPALERIGLRWSDLVYVINSHGHWDHMGGNEPVRKLAPQIEVLMHRADLPLMESIDAHIMGYHGSAARVAGREDLLEARRQELEENIDTPTRVDRFIQDGDVIDLGDLKVTVRHMPGHSDGICAFAINEGEHSIMITSDAAQARGSRPKRFPLIFNNPVDYLTTQRTLLTLQPQTICLGHGFIWLGQRSPELNEDEAWAFLSESAEVASILTNLAQQYAPHSPDFHAFAGKMLAGARDTIGYDYTTGEDLPDWALATLWQYWQTYAKEENA